LVNEFGSRGVSNREEIREILSQRKTILCMNGHDHGTDCRVVQGTVYYALNSMTYHWHNRTDIRPFEDEFYQKYPDLKHMVLYKDPLYCIIEIGGGKVRITGAKSDYWKITPEDVGILDRRWDNVSVQPEALDLEFFLPNS